MVLMNKFRIYATLCAIALLACELASRPFVELGIADDWSYIQTARILARTGHIVYNGWATAMLGWQLYLAAGFVRIFGFSFTAARMTTLLVGMVTAFLMQRTFVRAGICERNAAIGTLAMVLSPIYMMLSVTFMTDIGGLLAIVACIYGCLRALEASTSASAAGWICFAALTNGILGTSRQIAWLGVLVMVPCTLWLLRNSRRVVVIGGVAMLAGWGIVAFCMHWFPQQPYALQEHLFVKIAGIHQTEYMLRELLRALLEIPFLILAVMVAFLPEIRRGGRRGWIALAWVGVGYSLLAVHMVKGHGATAMLQPLLGDWLGPQGFYQYPVLANEGPVVLSIAVRSVLTAVTIAGLFSVATFLLCSPKLSEQEQNPVRSAGVLKPSWTEIGFVLGPFAVMYFALLIPRSKGWVLDRYMIDLALLAAICLTRAYEEFVSPSLPAVTTALVGLTALYSIGCTHDMFASYRARLALISELEAAGVPDNTVDGGFEFNYGVELEHAGHINDDRITKPPNSYVPLDRYRGFTCIVKPPPGTTGALTPEEQFNLEMKQETDIRLLHFTPLYGIAYEPDGCRGAAPSRPVSYFRWLGLQMTTLFAVRYGPR